MLKPIYVLNGPSLNLLGRREPDIYGAATLEDIRALCAARAAERGVELQFRQSNHEGVLIDWVHEARDAASAVVINPAAYSHTSIALLDALKACELPVIELHLSNPATRENYRRRSYVSEAATGVIAGFGARGYVLALDAAVGLAEARASTQAFAEGPRPEGSP